ncbi:MAG: hypothetical protein ACU0AX_00320 [Roseovarius sp.]|uniref:hypothetical protein n=1 Tax=Roseovarius sp. TaxID=1486281 RepID=UPI004058F375
MHRDTINRLLLAFIVAILAASTLIALRAPDYFQSSFAAEDDLVENGTALFLLVASLVLLSNAARLAGRGARRAAVLTGAYALLFFLAAGEEISWGQRIVGWASGDFFAANNYQGETNLHNLKVGEMRLARVLFGSVLTTVLLLYLVVLPLLYPRAAWLRRIADALAVPVPGLHHAVLALLASGVVAAIQVPRNWEVYELVFALLATAIFIAPQNPGKTR